MMLQIERFYFKAQIILLRLFKPTLLFDKINQLDWYQNTLRQWIDDQGFVAGNKILEIGCASGALSAYIADLACVPTGVDFSEKMIELAKRKNNQLEFLLADVMDLPFEAEQFDGVVAASLINIVKDKRTAMSELSRVCKKGGRVTVLVPLSGFDDAALYDLQTSLGNTKFSYAAMNAWHRLPPKMKTSDISELFAQTGLTEIKATHYLQGMVVAVSGLKPR